MKKSPELIKAISSRANAASRARAISNTCAGESEERWDDSLRVIIDARGSPWLLRSSNHAFQLDGARKQDVILQMHVFVKILFEALQILVQSLKTHADVRRRVIL